MIHILFCLLISVPDRVGTEYTDETYTILYRCKEDLESYEVLESTEMIQSGDTNENAFGAKCAKLKTVTFPLNCKLKTIGFYSFYQSNVESIDFSNCTLLTSILSYAFYNSKLSTLIFSDSISQIGSSVFCGTLIEEVTLPKSLESLNYQTFAAPTLTKAIVPEDSVLTAIYAEAFHTTKVAHFRIPKTVSVLENAWTRGELETVDLDSGNTNYVYEGSAIYSADHSTLILTMKHIGDFVLHERCTVIGSNAVRAALMSSFTCNSVLERIELCGFTDSNISVFRMPDTCVFLGESAFRWTLLSDITLGSGLKTISYAAFYGIRTLTRIEISGSVTTLGTEVFNGCSNLNYIFFAKSVTSIGDGSFNGVPPTCEIVFEDGSSIAMIGRCIYSANKEKLISYVGESGVDLSIENGVTEIGAKSVSGKTLRSITIPPTVVTLSTQAFYGLQIGTVLNISSVTQIGHEVFLNSNNISSIIFGDKLTKIYEFVFMNCVNLEKVDLKNVNVVMKRSFYGCKKLKSVRFNLDNTGTLDLRDEVFAETAIESITFPRSLISLGYKVFANSMLQSYDFPNGCAITQFGRFCFADCLHLSSAPLPSSLQVIGESSFENCPLLRSVILSDSIVNISTGAFRGCEGLSSVYISEFSALANIMPQAFEGCVSLMKFDVSNDNKNFVSEEGVLFDKERSSIVLYLPANPRESFTVESSINQISAYAFYGASNLRTITIEEGCTKIGFEAFCKCTSLQRISIPISVLEVHSRALSDCPLLRNCASIILPEGFPISILRDSGCSLSGISLCPTPHFTPSPAGRLSVEGVLINVVLNES